MGGTGEDPGYRGFAPIMVGSGVSPLSAVPDRRSFLIGLEYDSRVRFLASDWSGGGQRALDGEYDEALLVRRRLPHRSALRGLERA